MLFYLFSAPGVNTVKNNILLQLQRKDLCSLQTTGARSDWMNGILNSNFQILPQILTRHFVCTLTRPFYMNKLRSKPLNSSSGCVLEGELLTHSEVVSRFQPVFFQDFF